MGEVSTYFFRKSSSSLSHSHSRNTERLLTNRGAVAIVDQARRAGKEREHNFVQTQVCGGNRWGIWIDGCLIELDGARCDGGCEAVCVSSELLAL